MPFRHCRLLHFTLKRNLSKVHFTIFLSNGVNDESEGLIGFVIILTPITTAQFSDIGTALKILKPKTNN